jgi:C4-dicarboxylate-specific signal transduction histidine kinase
LIKNSIEALSGKKNGAIHLKAFNADDAKIIQVEDNGIGISGDIIEDIFVPFYTTKENCSGIGLSLSKQIMQNHDGTISVNSDPDKGAKFTLKFLVNQSADDLHSNGILFKQRPGKEHHSA